MTQIVATSNGSGSSYEPVPAGNYVARCISMVHIGTVQEDYQGEKKLQNKVRITFELPTETKVFKEENGEQPYVLSKEFTLSMHEKATLRKWLASWRGKDFSEEEAKAFDVAVLVGKPCMLNVIHKQKKDGGTRADISAISSMPKGLKCPEQVNPSVVFSVLDFDSEQFSKFPEFLQLKIKQSQEYKAIQHPEVVETSTEHETQIGDDLPF